MVDEKGLGRQMAKPLSVPDEAFTGGSKGHPESRNDVRSGAIAPQTALGKLPSGALAQFRTRHYLEHQHSLEPKHLIRIVALSVREQFQ